MSPARAPRVDPGTVRLLSVDAATARIADGGLTELADRLQPGDLLVCNDAATLPASLAGRTGDGAAVEVRLAGEQPDGSYLAVLFGAGDWRERTEDRAPPPALRVGARLRFDGLVADVVGVDAQAPRLVRLRFDRCGADLVRALYAIGRPVQYSHLRAALDVWDVQTPFAGRPWAVEAPSASLPVTHELLALLRARGVAFARVTHAAGLSSTGDAALDARLPFAERFEVPAATMVAVAATRRRGGRVVAAGTTVVRALESAALRDGVETVGGWTELRLSAATRLAVVDAILTGMHEPGTSHFELLTAFAPRELLLAAHSRATALGYLAHEFGDLMLLCAAPRSGRDHRPRRHRPGGGTDGMRRPACARGTSRYPSFQRALFGSKEARCDRRDDALRTPEPVMHCACAEPERGPSALE